MILCKYDMRGTTIEKKYKTKHSIQKMLIKIDCYFMAFKSNGNIYKSQPCTTSPYSVNTKLVLEVPFSLPWLGK